MHYLILLIFACLFSACSQVAYPAWYMESDTDTGYLYGVGEGRDLQSAKLAALNDIASKISLMVESSTNLEQRQANDEFSSNISNSIEIIVSEIELSNVEYPLSEQIDDRFFVKARMNKSAFIIRLNSDISSSASKMKDILNQAKKSKCATMSPKELHKLRGFFDSAMYKKEYILSLGGKVKQQAFLDNAQTILSLPSTACYVSFAQGGDSKSYQVVDNALMSEYSKFFAIIPKDSGIYYIENNIDIHKANGVAKVSIDTHVKDCNGATLFAAQLESTKDSKDKTIADTILRVRAQLYKKLNAWIAE